MEDKSKTEQKKGMDLESKKDAKEVNDAAENIEEHDDDFEDFEVDSKILHLLA